MLSELAKRRASVQDKRESEEKVDDYRDQESND